MGGAAGGCCVQDMLSEKPWSCGVVVLSSSSFCTAAAAAATTRASVVVVVIISVPILLFRFLVLFILATTSRMSPSPLPPLVLWTKDLFLLDPLHYPTRIISARKSLSLAQNDIIVRASSTVCKIGSVLLVIKSHFEP